MTKRRGVCIKKQTFYFLILVPSNKAVEENDTKKTNEILKQILARIQNHIEQTNK